MRAVLRAARWQARKRLVSRPMEVRVYGGFVLRAHTTSDSASNVIYFGDRYDPTEMQFMEDYLRRGDATLDIGANIRTYSLLAASLIGDDGRVDAFEPVPQLADWFAENVELNNLAASVKLHRKATGNHEGLVRFCASMDVSSRVASETDGEEETIDVACTTLDLLLDPSRQYALAKIDVEGSETMTLLGGRAHLEAANPPVLLLEVLDHQLRRQGSSASELSDLLHQLGYDFANYQTKTGKLEWIEDLSSCFGNVVAVSRSARDDVEARLKESATPDADLVSRVERADGQ